MFGIGIFMLLYGVIALLADYIPRKKAIEVDGYVTNITYCESRDRNRNRYNKYYRIVYEFTYDNQKRTYTKNIDAACTPPHKGEHIKLVATKRFVAEKNINETNYIKCMIFSGLGLILILKELDDVILFLQEILK